MMNRRGNFFIEYLILSLIVILATIWLYDNGDFHGVKQTTSDAIDGLAGEITK